MIDSSALSESAAIEGKRAARFGTSQRHGIRLRAAFVGIGLAGLLSVCGGGGTPGGDPTGPDSDPDPDPTNFNEPPGLSIDVDSDFDGGPDGFTNGPCINRPSGQCTFVMEDGRGVARMSYAPGQHNGYGTNWIQWTYAGQESPSTVYHRFVIKLSDNWQFHAATNKLFYYLDNSQGNAADPLYLGWQRDQELQFRSQGAPPPTRTNNFGPNTGANVSMSPGRWYTVEVLLRMNSAPNRQDGEGHIWVDGIKTHDYRNFIFSNGDQTWDRVRWDPIWGGTGGALAAPQYMYLDSWYVSSGSE